MTRSVNSFAILWGSVSLLFVAVAETPMLLMGADGASFWMIWNAPLSFVVDRLWGISGNTWGLHAAVVAANAVGWGAAVALAVYACTTRYSRVLWQVVLLGLLSLAAMLAVADFVRSRLCPPEKDVYLLPVIGVTNADAVRVAASVVALAGISVVFVFRRTGRVDG